MIKCELCGQELGSITWIHLKKSHGITMEEYRKKFPEAPLRSKERKPIKVIKQKFKKDKPKPAAIPIYEDGEYRGTITCNVHIKTRFKDYREEKGWTIIEALNTLIDHDIEFEKLRVEQKENEEIKKITEDLPENFTSYHRDQLQRILKILEERAFEERDAMKLASIADKVSKINLILPQLDKSYASDIDKKIQEITEKRKAVCLNYLYEDSTMPWSVKK